MSALSRRVAAAAAPLESVSLASHSGSSSDGRQHESCRIGGEKASSQRVCDRLLRHR